MCNHEYYNIKNTLKGTNNIEPFQTLIIFDG